MLPESNQASMTSVARRISAPQVGHGKVTSSIQGLWTMRCSLRVGSAALAAWKAANALRIERLDGGDAGGRVLVLGVRGARPHVEGRAPVALAREGPVDVVGEEVAEAALLDVVGEPGDRAVVGDGLLFVDLGADVPGRARELDERIVVGAPADRGTRGGTSPRSTRRPRARRSLTMSGSASLTKMPAKAVLSGSKVPSGSTALRGLPCDGLPEDRGSAGGKR